MKRCVHSVVVFVCLIAISFFQAAYGQAGVFNPNDAVVSYDASRPPAKPSSGQVGKWVRTVRVSWNTTSYKCYIYNYNGSYIAFRLKYPKNYDSTKAYPLLLFFHGLGEYGSSLYDNEYQLYHGGALHASAVDQGKFNGFLLYPQHINTNGIWSSTNMTVVYNLITKVLIPMGKVDPFRVYVDGLSAGGATTWQFTRRFPQLVAAATPISAAYSSLFDTVYKYTPIYHFQGGQDTDPSPSSARSLGNKILAVGGNYKYMEFPDRAHDCWYQAWGQPDYFPFYAKAHKANPWPLYGRTEYCQGETIRDTLGVTSGFSGYEWRKNGVVISGATSNRLVVTAYGTYDCRVKYAGKWSVWSPNPVVIKVKAPTVQPTITTTGLVSNAIPAPDGSTSVPLEVPSGFATYKWVKEGSTTVLSTTRFLKATTAGKYKVHVTEKYGCATATEEYSKTFLVVNANGTNKPDPVSNLTVKPVSMTSVQLTWTQTSSPAYNETGFEIYEATASGGPYVLKGITAANATGMTRSGLNSGTTYYYKVRAVNNYAASAVAGPANAATLEDKTSPSTPTSLRVGTKTRSTIELLWNSSTDNVGVTNYDIYVNGVKAYAYGKVTKATVFNLVPGKSYTFYLKARDQAGNVSASSNQVSTSTSTGYHKQDPSLGTNPANFSVYINMNADNPAGAPWNNTNILPSAGTSWLTLRNYSSDNSGIRMTIVDNYSGYNPNGMNTGSNSGIYPDNVMRSSYYCDKGQVAKVRLYNMSVRYKYSFIFFGSRSGTGDRTSVYTIGTQSVSLNASNNTTKTVQIDNVVPDKNGNVYFELSLGPTAMYAYLNALVIKAYTINGSTTTMIPAQDSTVAMATVPEDSSTVAPASVYPNPVVNDVTVTVPLSKAVPQLSLQLTDASGSTLSQRIYKNVPAGIWQQRIPLNGTASQPGLYFIHLSGLPNGKDQVLKVVKIK